jgi:uncharacterized protein YkwD
MRLRLPRSILLATAVLVAAAPSASAACPNESLLSAVQSEAQLEESLLCLINEERVAGGLLPVVPNADLKAAALRHSRDMVGRGYFGHTSPSGISFIDRIADTGYLRGAREWLVGENLAWGSGILSTPASLMRTWRESPPHYANLMKPEFEEIGIAAVRGTPTLASLLDGATVSSEFGYYRALPKGATKKAKRKKGRKGKASTRKRKSRP